LPERPEKEKQMDTSTNDEEVLAAIREIFDEKVPFHKTLGITVKSISFDRVQLGFKMRDDFVGNYVRGTLHGGVIASVVDITAGLAAFVGLQKKLSEESLEKKLSRIDQLGTIDLRVDYLRPGRGKEFTATGYTLRTGNKIAVVRIELHSDSNDLVAVGTGTYHVA